MRGGRCERGGTGERQAERQGWMGRWRRRKTDEKLEKQSDRQLQRPWRSEISRSRRECNVVRQQIISGQRQAGEAATVGD